MASNLFYKYFCVLILIYLCIPFKGTNIIRNCTSKINRAIRTPVSQYQHHPLKLLAGGCGGNLT
jgi:hypothetical protein